MLNHIDSKFDTDINHKEDKKVVINHQNQTATAFHSQPQKSEVQRRLDFDNQ